jgi:hypothetical protein
MGKGDDAKIFLSTANLDLSKYARNNEENKRPVWLNNLQEKPILELISEELADKTFNPVDPVQLNCYERLKKLLDAQKGNS